MNSEAAVVGYPTAVVAFSTNPAPCVPLGDATLYSLFSHCVRKDGRASVKQRLAQLKLFVSSAGKIYSRALRWWDITVLNRLYKQDPHGMAQPHKALSVLSSTIANGVSTEFGIDLPIHISSESTKFGELDWDVVEFDIMRGLNGRIPFDYDISVIDEADITKAVPFLDIEHFRGVVDGDAIIELTRQLRAQHTHKVGALNLTPVRWFKQADPANVVIATNQPYLMYFADPYYLKVAVGALDVSLRPLHKKKTKR